MSQAVTVEATFAPAEINDPDLVPMVARGPHAPTAAVPIEGLGHLNALEAGVAPGREATAINSERQSDDGCDVSAAASDSTAASATPDVGKAQHVVKNFVRNLVKGRTITVLTVNGSTTQCIASLDRKLTTLSLQRSCKKDAKKRGVPLSDITEVCIGEEAGDEIELPLDEFCVTLLLEDGNAVGFKFEDIEERDTFALCLSMFVDGRRGEVERKKREKA